MRDSIEVAQNKECVPAGEKIQYGVKLCIEYLIVSPTHLGRSIDINRGNGNCDKRLGREREVHELKCLLYKQ